MKRLNCTLALVILILCNCVYGQSNTWYTFPTGVPEFSNRYIYVDDQDIKWVGGFNEGLHKFNNGIWTHYTTSNSPLTDNDVKQLTLDTLGNLWMATWNKLNKYDIANNTWTNFNVTGESIDILSSLQIDNQNRIWVGGGGGSNPSDGLYMYDGTAWTFYNTANSPLTGGYIPQLEKDLTGKIWGCHYQGLFEINGTTITNHLLQPAGFPSNTTATCVDFDSYNNKWVGVYDGGIGKFDGSTWTIYNSSNSPLPENKIWSIAVDQNNVVWIGTETKGLVKFDGINWTIYDTGNSVITNNRINAISVDKLNNIWIAPMYGGIITHNSLGISGISGNVYYDVNNNEIQDSTEPFLPNQIINIDSSTFTSITNSSGNYYCSIPSSGVYNAKVVVNSPYLIGVTPDSITFTVSNLATNLTNQNFGIKLQPNIHDLAIEYTAMALPRPGFSYSCDLSVINIGSLVSDSINIKLKYDSNLIFDSTSYAHQLHQGDSLVWFIDSLSLFERKSIRIYFHLPPDVSLLGSTLLSQAFAYNDLDNDPTNNIISHNDLVVGAYDPNDKKVEPEGIDAAGYILSNTSDLTYTIRFQNTGTASASNIIIKDTISSNLDLSTFQMISASHNYDAEIKNGGIVWWNFNDINLPDSNSNEPASHGFLKYKIKLKPNLSNDTEIKNTGHIYFDFNPAIVTNTALNTIYFCDDYISLTDLDSSICLHEELGISVNSSQQDAIIWEIPGIVTQTGSSFLWQADTSGTFNLNLNKENNLCSYNETYEIIIHPLPIVDLLPFADDSVCQQTGFMDLPTGLPVNGIYSGEIINSNQIDLSLNTGSFYIQYYYSDQHGCSSADSSLLIILPSPVVQLQGFSSDTICMQNQVLTLPIGLPAGGFYSGTGVSENEFDPNLAPGNYYILYSYTDSQNCTASDSTLITVEDCLTLDENEKSLFHIYPNPFSSNIILNIDQSLASQYSLIVYDMLGKNIFEEHGITEQIHSIDLSWLEPGIYTMLFSEYQSSSCQSLKLIRK
ncbi:Two component regulator propeller [compost metagenome]